MIRVLFDNTEINGNYILNLTQIVEPYNQNFIIGNTVCRQFSIDVKDVGYSTIPDKVYLYEDNGSDTQFEWTKYATLLIDNTEVKDEHYTTFSLTDVMVRFNVDLTYTVGQTVLQILNDICTSKGITLNTQSFYMSDLSISWQDQIQERDLISYVAEVNGGYAYIDEDGNLNFEAYTNIPASNIDINKCSSYKVGELHKIGRVYVELATATQYYPQTTSDDTLYLNPDNILFTDSQGYTIEKTIKHIYDSIKDFMFYNIAIEQCPIDPNVRAGQIISVGGWSHLLTSDGDYILTSDGNKILVTEGLLVPFLCSIDWKYNTQWMGGYTTDLDCKVQEETQIVDTKKKLARINIKVDRELGVISQSVAQLDDDLNEVEAKLELKVSKDDNNQIISMINASADVIRLNSDRLIINSTNFKLSADGTLTCTNGNFSGIIEGTQIKSSFLTFGKDPYQINVGSYSYTQSGTVVDGGVYFRGAGGLQFEVASDSQFVLRSTGGGTSDDDLIRITAQKYNGNGVLNIVNSLAGTVNTEIDLYNNQIYMSSVGTINLWATNGVYVNGNRIG